MPLTKRKREEEVFGHTEKGIRGEGETMFRDECHDRIIYEPIVKLK